MAKDKDKKDEVPNPFVKGSIYRVRSLGTHEKPVETTGEFLGFVMFGVSGESLKIRLGQEHGEDAGRTRVIPNHMVLHVDVLVQKEHEEPKKEDEHPVSYS